LFAVETSIPMDVMFFFFFQLVLSQLNQTENYDERSAIRERLRELNTTKGKSKSFVTPPQVLTHRFEKITFWAAVFFFFSVVRTEDDF
jgi:hypothetical protein